MIDPLTSAGSLSCGRLYGAFGVDFSSLGAEGASAAAVAAVAMRRVCARLPEVGITAFCPAVRAHELPPGDVHRLLERLAAPKYASTGVDPPGARILGVHLDGPFFSREYAPATGPLPHLKESFEEGALNATLGAIKPGVRLVTLAPELPGALEAIRQLTSEGVVVGLGRTAAGLARCEEAVQAGARLVSHVCSHMPPFHHRDPGPIGLLAERELAPPHTELGAAHNDKAPTGGGSVFFSLAVAGQHQSTINLTHSTHPDGLVLLSCRRSLIFAEPPPKAQDDAEPVPLDGTLLTCARRLWHCSGSADPAAALLCGSAHPASLLGLTAKGTLRPGADADLLLLDPQSLEVRACYVRGKLTWADEALHGAFWFHV